MIRHLGILVLALGCRSDLLASTIQVPINFSTIQDAIDAAEPLDTIYVAPGTYNENLLIWKSLRLIGDANTTGLPTTIDGGGISATVSFVGVEGPETLLEGFTITNGDDIYGGGIAGNDTEATISRCVITGNVADTGGGLANCNGLIQDCEITYNTAYYGGGLYRCDGAIARCLVSENDANQGGGSYDCLADFASCTISANTSSSSGGGARDCDGSFVECFFVDNVAYGSGGGLIHCDGDLVRCRVVNNTVTSGSGGGLYYCNGNIHGCSIRGNSSKYDGGGMCDCRGIISNCVISGNMVTGTSNRGGGLADCGSGIRNCTIVGNKASNGGGLSGCNHLENCVVWFNLPLGPNFQQAYSCGTPEYCDIQDGDSSWTTCITSHPLFVDFGYWDSNTWVDGDYHLRSISPCRDAGDPVFTSSDTDIEGNPRVLNGIVDIGAYEFDPDVGTTEPDFDDDGIPDPIDPDMDNDGVANESDVCDYTPLGAMVQANGTLRADCDGDCDVDLVDFTIMQEEFTGPGAG